MSVIATELQINEISSTREINANNFDTGGVQDFTFSIGRPSAWIPSQSYFRFKLKVTAAGGIPSYITDKIALSENVCSNLYNNIYFRAGGQDVSSIVSHSPQAAQVKMRLEKTGAWQKTVGKSAFMLNPSFKERSKMISKGPYDVQGLSGDDYIVVGPAAADVAVADVNVTGTNGTTFLDSGVKPGDILFNTDLGEGYEIETVTSNTVMTVTTAGTEFIATTDFIIIRNSGDADEGRNVVYVMWKPPIAIFDHDAPMGAGDYKFSLNPSTTYKTGAVQTLNDAKAIGGNAGEFDFAVEDVKFYAATVKMEIPSQVQTLRLIECHVQNKAVTPGPGNSLQFTVPPSTQALTVFLQANEAGTNTKYSLSRFRTKDPDRAAAPPEVTEKAIQSIQITYGNVTKPNTQWTSSYTNTPAGNASDNQLQQRYVDTLREANLLEHPGGAEDYEDYLERGLMVHYSFLRDVSDKSTQVQITANLGQIPANTRLFLVAHYSRQVEVTTTDGLITSVRSLNV